MPKQKEIAGIHYAVMLARSQTKLAKALGVSNAVVSAWVSKGYVPDERVEQIHGIYGISRARLCNPIYLDWADDRLREEKLKEANEGDNAI